MMKNPVQCSQTRNIALEMLWNKCDRNPSNVNTKYLIYTAGVYGTRPRANIFVHVEVSKKQRPSSFLLFGLNFCKTLHR